MGRSSDWSEKKAVTPSILQMHASECGAACLGMVLGYFGRWVSLTELREVCEVSRDGSSAAGLLRASRQYGLDCKGKGLTADQLKRIDPPMILFWQYSHFVVLEGFHGGHVYVNDPATGRRQLTQEEFELNYSGVALQFKAGDDFQPGGGRPGLFSQLQRLFSGSWNAVALISACAVMLTLLALVIPFSLRSIVDDILAGAGGAGLIAAALIASGALAYILALFKDRFLHRLAVRISVIGYDRGLSRLLSLPIEFFSHRLVGDITDRVSTNDRIGRNLTEQFLVLLIDMAMGAVLFAVMLFMDYRLALIVAVLSALHGILTRILNSRIAAISETLRREQGMLLSIGMQILGHAENLRITGTDDRYFSRWSGQQARELRVRQLFAELTNLNSALPVLIAMFRAAAILGVGGALVMTGEMTFGTLVAYYFLAELFMLPLGRFFEFADKQLELETDLQRISDISETKEDPAYLRRLTVSDKLVTFDGRLQLAGHLELRNITFGFNRSRPPLIKDFNLTVKPGQRVALVGPSGSGKSTVARLVSGIFQPWEGEILFDGHPREDIPEEVMRRSISMVDQDVVLFPATVRDNITLWNTEIPDEAIYLAAQDACIHHEILVRNEGYQSVVDEGGRNFSGGQRQRMEIARALVGNPSLLLLDEATSSLDASTEESVDEALRRRGVTCLIVAHRLSTVKDSDLIVVMKNGKEVQRGIHDELIVDRDGVYAQLAETG